MATSKVDAKKIRRAVAAHADAIRDSVAVDMMLRLYSLPLKERLKWALKIARGLPSKEPLWSWVLGLFKRLDIEIAYRAKKLWARLAAAKSVVTAPTADEPTGAIDTDTELAWLKKEKKDAKTGGK